MPFFAKPPFFQSDPVASRGLGQSTPEPPRGTFITFSPNVKEGFFWFDVTLPDDYVAGDGFVVEIDTQFIPNGNPVAGFLEVYGSTLNGGPFSDVAAGISLLQGDTVIAYANSVPDGIRLNIGANFTTNILIVPGTNRGEGDTPYASGGTILVVPVYDNDHTVIIPAGAWFMDSDSNPSINSYIAFAATVPLALQPPNNVLLGTFGDPVQQAGGYANGITQFQPGDTITVYTDFGDPTSPVPTPRGLISEVRTVIAGQRSIIPFGDLFTGQGTGNPGAWKPAHVLDHVVTVAPYLNAYLIDLNTVPVNITPPVIAGPTTPGYTMAIVSNGTWTNGAVSFTYQWQADNADIPGVTNPVWIVNGSYSGALITCDVTAHSIFAASSPEPSNALGPIGNFAVRVTQEGYVRLTFEGEIRIVLIVEDIPAFTSPPFITGNNTEGFTLTGHLGTITNNPSAYTYQWYADAAPLAGENALTYLQPFGSAGISITFGVIPCNDVGCAVQAISAAVVTQAASADLPLADTAALFAMLNAGPVVSGNKSYILAPGEYGQVYLTGYDFSSAPIIVNGQAGVLFTGLVHDKCHHISWGGEANVHGIYPNFLNTAVQVINGSDHITFDGWTMIAGTPEGTFNGNGINVRDSSYISFASFEVQGRGNGTSTNTSNHVTYSIGDVHNFESDGNLYASAVDCNNAQVRVYDAYPAPGDHPDAFQSFIAYGSTVAPDRLTFTNCAFYRNNGEACNGFFFEGNGNGGVVDTCAVYGGTFNCVSQSTGSNFTANNVFCQALPDFGSKILVRDGVVNGTLTNCVADNVFADPASGPYPGLVISGSSTVPAVANFDYTHLNPFLAANVLVPGPPP